MAWVRITIEVDVTERVRAEEPGVSNEDIVRGTFDNELENNGWFGEYEIIEVKEMT